MSPGRIAICTSEGKGYPHVPLLLYADGGEFGVQATQSAYGYEIDNFYADGVRGVSDNDLIDAECDDSPMCAECRCLIDHWEDCPQ